MLFFFSDAGTTEIYTLSLHDALPICLRGRRRVIALTPAGRLLDDALVDELAAERDLTRSEEHTSELQSRLHLVCRLLLEKKNRTKSAHSQAHILPRTFLLERLHGALG